jgi:hypothetical protein
MKNIEYVSIKIECVPVESYLQKVNHEFVFKGEFFEECETIEEIRDKFYLNLRNDYVVDYIHIFLYKMNII